MTTTTDGLEPEKIIDLYAQVVKDVDAVGAGWIKVTRVDGRLQFDRVEREWVGLTWEEIDECFKITPDQYLPAHIYKRIEAKLKEKNT